MYLERTSVVCKTVSMIYSAKRIAKLFRLLNTSYLRRCSTTEYYLWNKSKSNRNRGWYARYRWTDAGFRVEPTTTYFWAFINFLNDVHIGSVENICVRLVKFGFVCVPPTANIDEDERPRPILPRNENVDRKIGVCNEVPYGRLRGITKKPLRITATKNPSR